MKLFICQTCSNEMTFNSNTGILTCANCGKEIEITEFEHPTLGNTGTSNFNSNYSKKSYNKEYKFSAPECNYSDNAHYFLPYKIKSADIPTLFKGKFINLFIKTALKKKLTKNSFRKLYIPIWVHDTVTYADMDAICTRFDNNTTNYYLKETKNAFVGKDMYTDASTRKIRTELSSLFPYNFENLTALTDKETSDTDAEYFDADIPVTHYKDILDSTLKKHARQHLNNLLDNFASAYNKEIKLDIQNISSYVVYLPVWEVTLDKKSDKLYINGQTGKVADNLPISRLKVSIAFLTVLTCICTILSFILFNFII